MVEARTGLFTVGVFQDAAWATKALAALKQAGFPPDSMTILSKDTPDAAALIEKSLAGKGERLELAEVGAVIARGSLMDALQGDARDLAKLGLAGTFRRVGFQAHDGRIFEALVGRGGVLVAVQGDPRAADALAILHSYGGGNPGVGGGPGRICPARGRLARAREPLGALDGPSAFRTPLSKVRTPRPCTEDMRLTRTHGVRGTCFAVAAV